MAKTIIDTREIHSISLFDAIDAWKSGSGYIGYKTKSGMWAVLIKIPQGTEKVGFIYINDLIAYPTKPQESLVFATNNAINTIRKASTELREIRYFESWTDLVENI